ncbi:ankyrin repeat-containing protein [Colletotrichum kahawae]|uniref:Ankyrin repeat-containing protein n=1 Tax=Colletotrichum kahawae TaxID=34407 RepID=A0AAE0DCH5_COLKA|nr:ankyrin repeat-containing protein [Colletotrichum kahawae]
MDPVSLSLAVAGILPVIATAINQMQKFYTDVIQAKSLIQQLMDEVVALRGNLVLLKDLLEGPAIKGTGVSFDQSSVLVCCAMACRNKLETLCESLEVYSNSKGRRLVWPLAQKKFSESLQTLRNLSFWIQLALTIEGCRLLSHTSIEVTNTLEQQCRDLKEMQGAIRVLQMKSDVQGRIIGDARQEQKRQEILQKISDFEYQKRHIEAGEARVEDTGLWIIQHPSFQTWRDNLSSHNLLWCHGLPGSGKTVLTSAIIDHLLSISTAEISISYFYLKYLDLERQTPTAVLASLLRQVLGSMSEVPSTVIELFESRQMTSKGMGITDYLRLIKEVAAGLQTCYIVLDALDECDQACRRHLLQAIHQLNQCQTVRVLATSRSFIPDIEWTMQKCPQILIEAQDPDLRKYMQHMITELDRYQIVDTELAESISKKVIAKANGTFLPVVLQLGTILQKRTRGHMEDAIGSISDDLALVFEQVMTRINHLPGDYRQLAQRVLAWLTHAKSALTAEEIGDALAVTDSIEKGLRSWSARYCPLPKMIIDCCQGFVLMEPSTHVLNLSHYTIREYFEKNTDKLFPLVKQDMASTCLSYLYPFLSYAARHWGKHVAETEQEKEVADLLSYFLQKRNSTAAAWQVMRFARGFRQRYWAPDECLSVTPLHLASRFGLKITLHRLLNNDEETTIDLGTAKVGSTPVIFAASEADPETLLLLLQYGANPFIRNWFGNALHCACEAGMSKNVRLLVQHGMKPYGDLSDDQGDRSPIACTLDRDSLDCFRTLVELSIPMPETDAGAVFSCEHPSVSYLLSLSVVCSAYKITKWLVENKQHHGTVEWLMQASSSPLESCRGSTPLLGASLLRQSIRQRNFRMVRLLVSCGVDPNAEDDEGQTLADYAAELGISKYVRALSLDLESSLVDASLFDNTDN